MSKMLARLGFYHHIGIELFLYLNLVEILLITEKLNTQKRFVQKFVVPSG